MLGKESREPPAAGERPGGRGAGGTASPGIPGASELPSCSNHLQCPVFSLCSSSGMKSLFLFYMNVQRGAHKWDKCVWEYLGGGNQPQILFLLCVLSKSCFLLQALNCMVLVSDFRKKRRKGERKVLVLQMPKGIRGEKTRGK